MAIWNGEEIEIEVGYKIAANSFSGLGDSGNSPWKIVVRLYDGDTAIGNWRVRGPSEDPVPNNVGTTYQGATGPNPFTDHIYEPMVETSTSTRYLGWRDGSVAAFTNIPRGSGNDSATYHGWLKAAFKISNSMSHTISVQDLNIRIDCELVSGSTSYDDQESNTYWWQNSTLCITRINIAKVLRYTGAGSAFQADAVLVSEAIPYDAGQPFIQAVAGQEYIAPTEAVQGQEFIQSIEAFPSSTIPAWAEVIHTLPSGYSSTGVTQLNYAALQQYGQENPGEFLTYTDENGNNYEYYSGTNNGVTTYQQYGAGEAYDNHNGTALLPYNIAGITHHVVDGSIGTLDTAAESAGFQVDVDLVDGDWYMVDLGYNPDSITINTPDVNNFLRINGDTIPIIHGCIPAATGGGDAYKTIPGDANYPNGYFGQMYRYPGATGNINGNGNVTTPIGGVICMPVMATEYGEERPVLRAVFQASSQSTQGLDKVRLSLWNCQNGLVEINDITVINISETGDLGGFSEEWSAQTTNNLINALSEPISYYENGGWVWNIPETYNGNGGANRIDYSWSGDELTSATSAGYALKFGIQPNPDTGTVEGKLYIRIETPEWEDGQTRAIRAVVDTAGDYTVFFNLDGSGISSIVQPEGSNASVSLGAQPADIPGIYARPINQDGSSSSDLPNWFIGKLDYLSIIDETSIVSGGIVGSWVFSEIDYDGGEINTLSAENVDNLLFAEEQIKWDEALKGLRVSQAIDQEILVGQKYDVSFNVTSYTSGSIEVAYYASPTTGFVFTVDGNESSVSETVEIQSIDSFDSNQHVIGSLMITSSSEDSLTTMSIDNITMTQIAFPEATKQTISYSEEVKGWTSFKSFIPESGTSVSKKYFTFKNGEAYQHYHQEATPNTFYNLQPTPSTITTLLNDAPELVKNFKTLNYEGSQAHVPGSMTVLNVTDSDLHNQIAKTGWKVSSIDTNIEGGSVKEFIEKEDKWFNYIKGKGQPKTSDFTFQGYGVLEIEPEILIEDNQEE
jgi:hypothetical protein